MTAIKKVADVNFLVPALIVAFLAMWIAKTVPQVGKVVR